MKKKEIARQSNSMDINILRIHNDFRSDNWFLMHGFGPRLDDWLFSRKNAKQRYEKGFCFWDMANMDLWFAEVIPAMLTELKQRFVQADKHNVPEEFEVQFYLDHHDEYDFNDVEWHWIALRDKQGARLELYERAFQAWLDTLDEIVRLIHEGQGDTIDRESEEYKNTPKEVIFNHMAECRQKAFSLLAKWWDNLYVYVSNPFYIDPTDNVNLNKLASYRYHRYCRLTPIEKHKFRNQRYHKGYCDWDVNNMDDWLTTVIPNMLETMQANTYFLDTRFEGNYFKEHQADYMRDGELREYRDLSAEEQNDVFNKAKQAWKDLLGEMARLLRETDPTKCTITNEYHYGSNAWFRRDDEIKQYRLECREKALALLATWYDSLTI